MPLIPIRNTKKERRDDERRRERKTTIAFKDRFKKRDKVKPYKRPSRR